jgi:hypothetical protein
MLPPQIGIGDVVKVTITDAIGYDLIGRYDG